MVSNFPVSNCHGVKFSWGSNCLASNCYGCQLSFNSGGNVDDDGGGGRDDVGDTG